MVNTESDVRNALYCPLTFRETHERVVNSLRECGGTWRDTVYQKLLDVPVDGKKIGEYHPELRHESLHYAKSTLEMLAIARMSVELELLVQKIILGDRPDAQILLSDEKTIFVEQTTITYDNEISFSRHREELNFGIVHHAEKNIDFASFLNRGILLVNLTDPGQSYRSKPDHLIEEVITIFRYISSNILIPPVNKDLFPNLAKYHASISYRRGTKSGFSVFQLNPKVFDTASFQRAIIESVEEKKGKALHYDPLGFPLWLLLNVGDNFWGPGIEDATCRILPEINIAPFERLVVENPCCGPIVKDKNGAIHRSKGEKWLGNI